jgi:hypothetical protein
MPTDGHFAAAKKMSNALNQLACIMSAPLDLHSLEFIRPNAKKSPSPPPFMLRPLSVNVCAFSYELQPNALSICPVAGSIWATPAFRREVYKE